MAIKTPSWGIDQNKDEVFMDKYWGRVPQYLHEIPEAYICVVNPEYIFLINGILDGTLDERNLSIELYRELITWIDKMCAPCLMSYSDRKIYRAWMGLEACILPPQTLECDATICCDKILNCTPVACP